MIKVLKHLDENMGDFHIIDVTYPIWRELFDVTIRLRLASAGLVVRAVYVKSVAEEALPSVVDSTELVGDALLEGGASVDIRNHFNDIAGSLRSSSDKFFKHIQRIRDDYNALNKEVHGCFTPSPLSDLTCFAHACLFLSCLLHHFPLHLHLVCIGFSSLFLTILLIFSHFSVYICMQAWR